MTSDTDDRDREPDPGDLEHAERLAVGPSERVGDDEVGRRAEHRDDAAEDARVRQGHQESRCGTTGTSRPPHHARGGERDQRGVGDERGHRCHRRREPADAARPAEEEAVEEPRQRPVAAMPAATT
jgi:hypothetical protein